LLTIIGNVPFGTWSAAESERASYGEDELMDGMIESQIRERAYAIWEREGRPDGREWDHWVRAIGEVSIAEPTIPVMRAAARPGAKPAAKRKSRKR
jgi:hypothetical protein